MSIDHRHPPFKAGDKVCRRVEIRRLIGSGGQGFVYEGIHEVLKKPLAVKAIPNTLDTTRNLRQRAVNEGGILFDLQHPNLVRVTDVDVTDDGVVCIVMELLKGRSLRALLRELNRVRVDEALLIGAQIAEGVQAAHEQKIIHRDLKPENVYIEPGNAVKVLDFGIAKITGIGAVTTQENLIQGTVQYMSPEHLQGREVTARTDIFALGCILYELISGSTPAVIGVESVTMHIAGWNQVMLKPPRLDVVSDDVPPYVGRAIQLILAKEPAERPASMAQVASELRALYARYVKNAVCVSRELWHEGAGAAPLPSKPIPPMATTTRPDAVEHQGREDGAVNLLQPRPATEGVIAQPQLASNPTKPLPLMVRNSSLEPVAGSAQSASPQPKPLLARSVPAPEASVVVREAGVSPRPAPAQTKPNANAGNSARPLSSGAPTSQDTLARAIVAGAERVIAQQRTEQKSPGAGVPVAVAAPDKSSPARIHWHKVVAAIGTGSLVGALALLGSYLVTNYKEAKADPSGEVKRATELSPPVTAIPSVIVARPVPTGAASINNTAAAAATPPSTTAEASPKPQVVARHELQPASNPAPPRATNDASTKPAPHKSKAPAGKLPFSADELTF